eukprot:scaffold9167_cov160-Skeletonema_menzelii.AAC.3
MHQTISTPYNQRRVAALMMATVQLLLLSFHKSTTTAFQTNPPIIRPRRPSSSTTTLFLEDHIANMIDNEMRRLYQKQDTQSQWEARQRALQAEIHVIPDNYNFDAEFDDSSSSVVVQGFTTSGVDRSTTISGRTRHRDEKMVENDPMRYCADRCVSTGNCDVFEDMFDMVSVVCCLLLL